MPIELTTILNDLMYRFLRKHPDAKVLPVHSHPIECLSSRDEKTLRTLAKFKLNYALVVTPTTINGYYTNMNGSIQKIPVDVIDDSKFPEQSQRKVREYLEGIYNGGGDSK